MDNDFYERKSRKNNNSGKKQNIMKSVIIVQLVLSLLISGIVFAVCKTESNLSQNIKSFYKEISKTDIAVSEILDVFKNVAKQTFSPMVDEEVASEIIISEAGDE